MSLADRHVHRIEIGVFELLGYLLQQTALANLVDGEALLAHRGRQRIATLCERVLTTLTCEPLTDLVARSWGLHHLEPVARRRRRTLRGDDLDGVAGDELVVQGDETPVDARTHRSVPYLGVDRIREVQRCGAALQSE